MKPLPPPLRLLTPFLAAMVVLALVAMVYIGSLDGLSRGLDRLAREERIVDQLQEARAALAEGVLPVEVPAEAAEGRRRLVEAGHHLAALDSLYADDSAARERLAVVVAFQRQSLQATQVVADAALPAAVASGAAPAAAPAPVSRAQAMTQYAVLLEEAEAAADRAREDAVGARRNAWQMLWALLGLMATMLASACWTLFREANARHHLSERLKYEVTHDSLTGLPNRRFFNQWMERALAQARRERRQIALLYLDLDGYRRVHDRLGHEIADRLLRVAAKRFRETIRESDMLVALGGDEFAILSPASAEPENAGVLAERLCRSLEAPLLPQFGEEYPVGVSIGVAFYPRDGISPADMLKVAEQAMQVAKREGGGRCRFASPSPEATPAP